MEVFCRREIKFLIDRQQRRALEAAFAGYMMPDRFAHSSICNVYYDTPDYRLIRRSLEHPVYKEKIRLRCYGNENAEVFLEMKKKYDGIVYKRRMCLPRQQAEGFMAGQTPIPNTQIGRELTWFRDFYQNLEPRMFVSYERDSWIGVRDPGLRITMDDEVRYRMTDLHLDTVPDGDYILEPGMSLMEVKAENAIPLWLTQLLAKYKVSKTSFSKYGRAYERELSRMIEEKRGNTYVESNL